MTAFFFISVLIIILSSLIGWNENVYSNPMEFQPDRWMSPTRSVQELNQYEFPVFQAGPRICLGKDLAFYEAKIFTVEVLKKFKIKLPDKVMKSFCKSDVTLLNGVPVYQTGVTLSFAGDLNLVVERR